MGACWLCLIGGASRPSHTCTGTHVCTCGDTHMLTGSSDFLDGMVAVAAVKNKGLVKPGILWVCAICSTMLQSSPSVFLC